jgi:hypothetical protein
LASLWRPERINQRTSVTLSEILLALVHMFAD